MASVCRAMDECYVSNGGDRCSYSYIGATIKESDQPGRAASGGGGRVVSLISYLISLVSYSRSRSRSRLRKRGGRSVQKWQGKNRGAGKIESRRVLAGRGRNTLQGVDCIQGNRMSSVPGQATPQECSKKREVASRFSFRIEQTLSGSVDGKKGIASETHGPSNGTHRDVGKVDMCVLYPAPRNPSWKWGRGGCYNWYQSQKSNSSEASPRSEQRKVLEPRCSGVLEAHERINKELQGGNASADSSNIGKVETEGDMEAGKKERARQGVALRFGKMTPE
ncbi:hypothetical protein DY000_02020637 [Brassica cretica]|uniref:Uncharacterized protein n=1 Tax=Brassica cretica TaxID=69181 RepID=A0ABQ7DZJ5_BRACR|nr:hypothetical protein DY000_02020637 [Brassica cretica]